MTQIILTQEQLLNALAQMRNKTTEGVTQPEREILAVGITNAEITPEILDELINKALNLSATKPKSEESNEELEQEHDTCIGCGDVDGCDICDDCADEDDDEEDLEGEEYVDEDEYVTPPLRYRGIQEKEGNYVLFVQNPNIEPGVIVDDPYVGRDFQVATGKTITEVEEKYAQDIEMLQLHGFSYSIKQPTEDQFKEMMEKKSRYVDNVKTVYEAQKSLNNILNSVRSGQEVSKDDAALLAKASAAAMVIDPKDNYHS